MPAGSEQPCVSCRESIAGTCKFSAIKATSKRWRVYSVAHQGQWSEYPFSTRSGSSSDIELGATLAARARGENLKLP